MRQQIRDMRYDEDNIPFIKSLKVIYKFLQRLLSKLFVLILAVVSFTSCQSEEKIKLEQYYIGGKELYEQNCANCHQKDGKGLQSLYPPIAGSDYLKDKEKVIYIIKNGLAGEILVNGKKYNQPMPANNQLTNLDIAEVVTYIYNEWHGETKITEVKEVEKVLNNK
ncbi:cytochrome c [Emticicia sp. W12TSBA100-4]|uniref:c-type cytochrome n=1 Tax=Emticicia sp. W12TSBA100-4 TaxID=3160965 RepID=UPI0033069117